MIDLKEFVLPEQDSTLEIVGTVADMIKDFEAKTIAKSKYALILINNRGERLALTISKAVGSDLDAGKVKPAQLAGLNVIAGKNASGDDRLYISYSTGGTVDAKEFLTASKKIAPYTRRFSLEDTEIAG